jgi:hypothetical protein
VVAVTVQSQESSWRPVFAALANAHTRRIYASIVLEQSEPGVDLSPSRRRHAIRSLLMAGLIEERGGSYVASDAFSVVLRTAPRSVRRHGVDRFLTPDGRIDQYPARPADRVELLRHILGDSLKPGEVLREAELNERLARYHDDFATLRRYLVDHDLLERLPNGAEYTRKLA